MRIFEETKLIWRYLKPYKKEVCFIAAISLLGASISAAIPYLYGKLTDLVIRGIAFSLILKFLGLWLVLSLIKDWSQRNSRTKGHYLGTKIGNDLLLEITNHLLNLPLKFHKNKKMGKILSKVNRAEDSLFTIIDDIIFSLSPQFFTATAALGIIFWQEWRLATFLVLILAIYTLTTFVKTISIVKAQKKVNKIWEESYGDLYDSVLNAQTVKSFTREDFEKRKLYKNFQIKILRISQSFFSLWRDLDRLQQTIFSVGLVFLFGFALFLLNQNLVSAGELVMFIGYISLVYSPFTFLANQYKRFRQSITTIKNAVKLLEEKPEEYSKKDAVILKDVKGKIEFQNATFGYRKNKPTLEDISFKVSPGEVVALVGESGVGKSTLIDLISRYYISQKGKILVDGVDIAKVDLKSLREQIAIVPQEIMLFNDTVKNNIGYGRAGASDEEIIEAAKIAHAHEFIESFPKKYEQIVGERGIKLSGGQKQRIAIARAVLRNPKILILDEATSSLDAKSERLVHEALDKLIHNRTTFIIAHRLSTVRKADKIIVLEKGKIAEIGNHEELMAAEGVYFKLYSLQIDLK